jgi:hypothetical protein
MIEGVSESGFVNISYICYINAHIPMVFHIPHPRLMILAWPNGDPIVSNYMLCLSLCRGISLQTLFPFVPCVS